MQNIHQKIDIHIGKRANLRRYDLKLSLEKLSLHSGISIADLHRLEEGKLRVTAAQVFHLSHALHVSASYFFETFRNHKTEEIERLLTAYLHITNADLKLQYRGRLDDSGRDNKPDGSRDLFMAMSEIAKTGKGPEVQKSSIGCSIKWKR